VRPLRLLAPLVVLAAATACASSSAPSRPQAGPSTPSTPSATSTTPAPSDPASPSAAPAPQLSAQPALTWHASGQQPTKVLVFVDENKTAGSALAGMPYLASLARTYGRTTAYRAIRHPSLPNYLAIAGGSTFGVADDQSPAHHPLTGPSVFDRAIAAGKSAKTYAEAMPSSCALAAAAPYAVKHNPWAYFADATSRANCRRFDVPMGTTSSGALRSDVVNGRLPNVGLAIPDLCHDGHNCSLQAADDWLRPWLELILAGPDFRRGQLAVVVTFDEDDKSADNTVLTVVLSPTASRVVATSPYTHYSLSRYLSQITGTAPLRLAGQAPDLRGAFGL
jgi:acid phosphatase